MKSTIFAFSLLVSGAFAVPQPAYLNKLKRAPGPVKENSYIVKLKDNASRQSALAALDNLVFAADDTESFQEVTYDNWSVINGYAAKLGGAALRHVLDDPNVEYVEEDGIFTIQFDVEAREASPEPAPKPVSVSPLSKRAGEGTTFIGIDTGIRTTHQAFGGRASWGATFGGWPDADGNGHGTHTAGTAAGEGFGPATGAKLIAVKVLSDGGSGAWSDVISGINWAAEYQVKTGEAVVANMSLGGGVTQSVDDAVTAAIASGTHFAIAAGNSNIDAAGFSPARVATANTVGAVDSSNRKASFSNYGSVVDVWDLGVNVLSTWATSDTATNIISGTSMATPGVAGKLLVAISEFGNKAPAELSADLVSHAAKVVDGAPSGTTNLLAQAW